MFLVKMIMNLNKGGRMAKIVVIMFELLHCRTRCRDVCCVLPPAVLACLLQPCHKTGLHFQNQLTDDVLSR